MNSFSKNKEVVGICKNYYKIINADIEEGDSVTVNLIRMYEDYLFGMEIVTKREKEKLENVDKIIYRYMTDSRFKKELVDVLSKMKVSNSVGNLVEYVMNKVMEFAEDYKDIYTRNIYIPRWI